MTTPVLSVGEERGGFTGIFEIVAADKARVGRVEKETLLRAERRLLPLAGLGHPCRLCHPYLPNGRRGQGTTLNQCAGQQTIPKSHSRWPATMRSEEPC